MTDRQTLGHEQCSCPEVCQSVCRVHLSVDVQGLLVLYLTSWMKFARQMIIWAAVARWLTTAAPPAAVCSSCGVVLHSKLAAAAAAAAAVAALWVAGCQVASDVVSPLWAGVLPAPMNVHDGCCGWWTPAGDWPRSARVPDTERGWHGGNDAELTHTTWQTAPATMTNWLTNWLFTHFTCSLTHPLGPHRHRSFIHTNKHWPTDWSLHLTVTDILILSYKYVTFNSLIKFLN